MDLLDLSVVNLNSPYSVWNVGDYYYFRTSHGAVYKVSFMQDDTIWENNAYQFIIVNENNTPSPNDRKLRETIFSIIENFFSLNSRIFLYICETGDGKQALRNKLFVKWFKTYAKNSLYYFEDVEIEAEDIRNFAAIIVKNTNPRLNDIVETFDYVVDTLSHKPV